MLLSRWIMKRSLLVVAFGMLCAHAAFAGRIVTAKGGDPTTVHPGSSFSITAGSNGGGIQSYINGGPGDITDIFINLTVNTAPGEFPSTFTGTPNPTPPNFETGETTITGIEVPPAPGGQQFYSLTVASYIFSTIALSGYTTNFACGSSVIDNTAACLTIEFSGGSILPNEEFSFDLNNNTVPDIDTTDCAANSQNPQLCGTITPGANYNGVGDFPDGSVIGATPNPSTVPEPAAAGLLAFGGAALLGIGARRRTRA